MEEERKKRGEYEAAQRGGGGGGGWGSWLWGSSSATAQSAPTAAEDPILGGTMTEEQRKELYDALDFDEKAAVTESLNETRDALKARVVAKLNKGSFALKSDPHGKATEIISIVFDVFQANVLQRPDNLESSVSLGGFRVFDGTVQNTLYSQIVHVKDNENSINSIEDDPFFFLKFENKPLDERADMALALKLRHMEIIYHRGYIEAVYQFFKPPASQLESVEALLVSSNCYLS
jgi:vacuolar protein sorting-associated protein 13A/C